MKPFKIIIDVEESGASKFTLEPAELQIPVGLIQNVFSEHAKNMEREIIIQATIQRSMQNKVQLFQNLPSLKDLKKQ